MSFLSHRFKRLRPNIDRLSASDYNRLVDFVEKLAASLLSSGFMDASGIVTRRPPLGATTSNGTLFEVQSAGTGDGIYNCYEQNIDATEWADTAGDDKLDDKNSTSVEVLNLMETDPDASYSCALAQGDRLRAWQQKDDEGNKRWIGIPLITSGTRRARTTAAAGSGTTIVCNLIKNDGTEITSGLGSGITVNCDICGGSALNAAIPRLADDDYISVYHHDGKWYCNTVFQTSEDCDCYSE